MPADACIYFHSCTRCGITLKPKPGDCCVFCSYGSVPCPPVQAAAVRDRFSLPERYLVVIWPTALSFMGVACLINARRCGRVHCYVTGPFFLILAAAALLHGLRVVWLGKEGWNILGLILIVGSALLSIGTEWIFGKYRRANGP